jgi:hypothetical protein
VSTGKSERLFRVLLFAAAGICALAIFEIPALLRIVDYRGVFGEPFQDDLELGFRHLPHAHSKGRASGGLVSTLHRVPRADMKEYRWDLRYDQNGFRNEVDLQKADIAVIGDSFVEGSTIPFPQLMTSRLAHLQGKVTANLGLNMYGPHQELIVLKRYGLPLEPQTVLWVFAEGSDLHDILHDRQVRVHPPAPGAAIFERSFTKQVIRAFMPLLVSRPDGRSRSGIVQTSGGKRLTEYFLRPIGPLDQDLLSAIDETTRVLGEAYAFCRAHGVRLVFVFAPDKFRVFHDFCQFPEYSECRNWTVPDLPARLERGVASISPDIGFLDLTPALVNVVKSGILPYFTDDVHWSPEGHEAAAEAINQYLVDHPSR